MNNHTSRIVDWRDEAASKLGEARNNLGHVGQSIEHLIKRYPAACVAVSVGLGVLLGFMIKRR